MFDCNVFAVKQCSRHIHTNDLSRVLLQGSQKQPSPEQIVLVPLTVSLAYLALSLLTFPAMLNVVWVVKKGFLLLVVKSCRKEGEMVPSTTH